MRETSPRRVRVSIRPAIPDDKQPIVAFCKNIWGGHDYLPEVWDDWIKDKKARLLVATVNKKPVGVAHAYLQDKETAWLEGVRVDPRFRGHGIAGRLNRELFEWSRKNGAKVARLCTGKDNKASQRHLLKTGFKPLQTFARYTTSRPLRKKPDETRLVGKYTRSSWKRLTESQLADEYRGMYADGWTWYPLTRVNLSRLIGHKRVFQSENGQTAYAVGVPDHRGYTLGLVTGNRDQVESCARYMRCLLKDGKPERRIRAVVPMVRSLEKPLKDAGFRKRGATVVYEKRVYRR